MGWVTEFAPTDAELSSCVQCGLCLPHCPTFRLTGKETASPRGRLLAMSAVAAGLVEVDQAFADIIDPCLQCRACEAACPSMVPFGRAMEGARVELFAQRATMVARARHLVVGRLLDWRPLVRWAARAGNLMSDGPMSRIVPARLRGGVRGLRREAGGRGVDRITYPAQGQVRGAVALLSGCVMDSWFSDVHHASIALLTAAGYEVSVPDGQACCGALAAHDGDAADASRLASRNVTVFDGFDHVVADAAGCAAHLKDYGHWAGEAGAGFAARVREVTEVIAAAIEAGALPRLGVNRGPVAVQDPCHNRHAQRILDEPRVVLRAAGYDPVDVDPAGMCCGAAGTYSILYPEASSQLGRRKAEEVRAVGSTVVASANPGCEMQLRSHLGESYLIRHPVELYFEAWEAARSATDAAG